MRLPQDRPAVFLVLVERQAPARWLLWLLAALGELPRSEVFVRLVASPHQASALATLLSLEQLLLRRGRTSGADRVDPAEFAGQQAEPAGLKPDIVIDLTPAGDAPLSPDVIVLRPLFNGHGGEMALASALFFQGTPVISIERSAGDSQPRIIGSGVASLEDAAGIGGGIEAVGSRVIALILRSLAAAQSGQAGETAPGVEPTRAIARTDIVVWSARQVARAAVRAAYRLCCHGSHWRIGWRFVDPGQDVWTRGDLGGRPWAVLADPVDHFYADPFPLTWKGRDYLFFEDLDYKTGKGIIAVTSFDEAGRPGPVMPVLEEPWHLSYPFLIESGGDIFMIPESSNNRDIAIYRATDFPLQWQRHAVLVDGVEAADATLVEHDGRWWMFAVVRDGVGGYSDMLAIWSSNRLFGPWTPHAGNPLLIDDRTARPAGNMVQRDGMLYRPVQDCRRSYGASVSLMEVTRLDEEGFAQQAIGEIAAGPSWPGSRVHTLNYNGRLETIDGFTLRPRLKVAADLVDWWYRPPG